MISKETARRFCSFWNMAEVGSDITVFANGDIRAGEHQDGWFTVAKADHQFASTQEAHEFLVAAERRGIQFLNDRMKKVVVGLHK